VISYQIDGITYRLHTDGGLSLEDQEGQRVELSGLAVFGLALFLRLPGVRPTVERAEVERQRHHDGTE
jgi:hypothetical protein